MFGQDVFDEEYSEFNNFVYLKFAAGFLATQIIIL